VLDTLSMPNYTGSTGFGDFYVQELIGRCGTLDVQDVKACVDRLVKEGKGEHGPGKQFVLGGSHGGFLTAHREYDQRRNLVHLASLTRTAAAIINVMTVRCRGDSHRPIPGRVLRGGDAQPRDQLAACEHRYPRLVHVRVRWDLLHHGACSVLCRSRDSEAFAI
jgi:hypothetical protein